MSLSYLGTTLLIFLFQFTVSVSQGADSTQNKNLKTGGVGQRIPIRDILEYDFRVSWFDGAPNGMMRRILGVNNQFPGPTIRGKKGDLLRVHVTNAIQTKQNLSIHSHKNIIKY